MKTQHLENVIGHLGLALCQQAASDDKIIMGHVRDAYEAAQKALIVIEGRDHCHAAGTMVGKDIDECAVCGRDIRDPIHAQKPKSLDALLAALPVIGVLNVDNPHDPRHKEWGRG